MWSVVWSALDDEPRIADHARTRPAGPGRRRVRVRNVLWI